MKMKVLFALVVCAAVFSFAAGNAFAAAPPFVHDFACENCHFVGTDLTSTTGNICITCHGTTSGTAGEGLSHLRDVGGLPMSPSKNIAINMASDALGSRSLEVTGLSTGPGAESSHNWNAPDVNPAAGALAPLNARFDGRKNYSGPNVTCARCHDPHGFAVDVNATVKKNPKLLKLGAGTEDAMCIDCHRQWDTATANGYLTHPMVTDYPGFLLLPTTDLTKFKTFDPPVPEMALGVDPTTQLDNSILCSTCHGVHFADSDSSTAETPAGVAAGSLNPDGKLLRATGASGADATARSMICNSCHVYASHGAANELGCLDCHSGHSYDPVTPGSPNYFVLRATIENVNLPANSPAGTGTGPVARLMYKTSNAEWLNAGKSGYCQSCHLVPLTLNADNGVMEHNGFAAGSATDCSGCHGHANTSQSFGGSCNTCHGYAPSTDTPGGTTGYAFDSAGTGYRYSLDAAYLPENNTPHAAHANGTQSFSCEECHPQNSATATHATHNTNTFQDVDFGGGLGLASSRSMTPVYTPAGLDADSDRGTCSAVYCHSNGGPRGVAPSFTSPGAWENGSVNDAIGPNTCNVCHGNDVASMTTKTNSAAHEQHLVKGYSCQICHSATATSSTVLAGGATHINGAADVSSPFDSSSLVGTMNLSSSTYTSTGPGTCAVYCHNPISNGTGNWTADPNWDESPTWNGATEKGCDSCHPSTTFAATYPASMGSGAWASGAAHVKHLYAADGPGITDCKTCHTNDSTSGITTDHINGLISVTTGACNACHGSITGNTSGPDQEPSWIDNTSVSCETCHTGIVISTIDSGSGAVGGTGSFVDQSAYDMGHGKVGVNSACIDCHDTGIAHFNGDDAVNRLLVKNGNTYIDDKTLWCQQCHAPTPNTHIAPGNTCAACHEPHGKGMAALGNTDAMLIVGNDFTDKVNDRYSYVKDAAAGFNGVCQTCHTAPTKYFNTTTFDDTHNAGKVCTDCHKHDAVPAFNAGCTDCHGNTTNGNFWPDSEIYGAQNGTVYPNRLGSHETHINKIATQNFGATPTMVQKNSTCNFCHPGGGHSGDQLAAPADLHDPGTTSTNFLNIIGDVDTDGKGTLQDGGTNVSCATVDCHYNQSAELSGDLYSMNQTHWYSAANESACTYCHGGNTSGGYTLISTTRGISQLPNAHDTHVLEAASGGRGLECLDCHASPGVDNSHENGVVDMKYTINTPIADADGVLVVDQGNVNKPMYGSSINPADFATCANLYCHGDFIDGNTTNTPNWFNTDAQLGAGAGDGVCGSCHGIDTAGVPSSGRHGKHVANTTFVVNSCSECHTAETATTHTDGKVDNTLGYDSAAGGGCTNNCHLVDDVNAGDWLDSAKLDCANCHEATGKSLYTGWPPTAATAHVPHVGNTSYVTGANCTDCHNDNSVTHSTIDSSATSPTLGAKVTTYNAGAGTCANSCHGGIANFNTSTPAPLCIDCHSSSYIGSVPTSGLHATTKAQAHDASFDSGTKTCTHCHSAVPSDDHMTGTLQDSTAALYAFEAAITTPYTQSGGCTASCHSDGGDWSRKWIGVVDDQPALTDAVTAPVCANCHGTFSGWNWNEANPTTTDHTNPDPDNAGDGMANHNDCTLCHGWSDASYTATGGKHINGNITMNGPAGTPDIGAGYDNATGGCAINCHGAMDLTLNSNSGWTADFIDAGGASCGSCHADGSIPPTNAGHFAHNVDADTDYTECVACHGDNGGNGYLVVTGLHNNGSVNFAAGVTYSGGTTGTCSTTTCHSPGSNTTTWGTAGSMGCDECHYYEVTPTATNNTANANALSADHGNHFDAGFVCTECHVAVANRTHIATPGLSTDGANLTARANAVQDTATVIVNTWDDITDTCNNAACHNPSGTTYKAVWQQATPADCTLCHSDSDPGTGSHNAHLDASTKINYGLTVDCASCHGTLPTSTAHLNSTVDFDAGLGGTGYPSAAKDVGGTLGSCSITACHNDGTATANNEVATPLWGTPSSDACGTCHEASPTSNKHQKHLLETDYITSSCDSCHTAETAVTHINTVRNMDTGVISVYNVDGTCTNTCHAVTSGRDWNDGTALNCTDCHGAGKSLISGTAPPSTGYHAVHVSTMDSAYGSTTRKSNGSGYDFACGQCHGTDTHLNAVTIVDPAVNGGVAFNTSVKDCSSNSCHSNGNSGAPAVSPNWITGIGSGDKCANCHGNSPATGAHSVHAVGIHAATIYTGTAGLQIASVTSPSAHGDGTTSTVISCNTCHNNTVNVWNNAQNATCSTASCHTSGAGASTGDNDMTISGFDTHVNGTKDVVFQNIQIKSRAQLRDVIADAAEVNANWTRTTAYKGNGDYDLAKTNLTIDNFADSTCTTACHNGIDATWTTPTGDCTKCHTTLPQ